MPKLKMKVTKVRIKNISKNKMGYTTRLITNGTASLDEMAENASHNTTLHKAELKMAFEMLMEEVANMLEQGYIVDLGRVGKIYPRCTSNWVEKASDLSLDDVKPTLYYRPGDDIAGAVRSAVLQWSEGNS